MSGIPVRQHGTHLYYYSRRNNDVLVRQTDFEIVFNPSPARTSLPVLTYSIARRRQLVQRFREYLNCGAGGFPILRHLLLNNMYS